MQRWKEMKGQRTIMNNSYNEPNNKSKQSHLINKISNEKQTNLSTRENKVLKGKNKRQ